MTNHSSSPLSSHQERRTGTGSPVPARGRTTGGRQQPAELVPVAPITGKGGAVQATVGTAPPTRRASGRGRGVALIVTALGLAVFGFLNEVGRPNGLTLLVLILLAAVLWALVATARGYRVLDRRDIAYTEKKLKQTKDTGGSVAAEQLVQLLGTLLRPSAGQREGTQR